MVSFQTDCKTFVFSKYSGCGNDFVIIDNRSNRFPTENPKYIQRLLDRRLGIGADGLILLESSALANFRMRIFNSDATEAEMCGNGIRCLLQFAAEHGFNFPSLTVETLAGNLLGKITPNGISIQMPNPTEIQLNKQLSLKNEISTICSLNTGVPHAILFVDDIEAVEVEKLGPEIRHHSFFNPKGSNVNWVQILNDHEIAIRTFERGVEGETLACGTGSTAAALAASMLYQLNSPLNVRTKSNETLTIHFSKKNNKFHDVWMCGPAIKIFEGKWHS